MATLELHVDEAGSGPPVVLLHAFPLSSAMWAAQREALAAGFRVVTPDLRGFGASPLGHDAPSLDAMADDVAALLDRLGLERVVLGGLSMGGYVAMAFLRRHRDRVRGLVLADTKAGADPEPAQAKRERVAARLDAEQTTDALVDEVLPALTGPTTQGSRPEVVDRVTALVRACPPAAAAWAQRAMAARPDSLETLADTDVPALVVRGAEDALATREDAEAMVAVLQRGRLVVLEGAGHLTALEVPDDLTAALRGFLDDLG
ncbi:MAG TPA: alpha/beta hydrolase [Actinomycetes bacterium]|nr:alpha/beta hydrolase [Actinomycetes bacterium]